MLTALGQLDCNQVCWMSFQTTFIFPVPWETISDKPSVDYFMLKSLLWPTAPLLVLGGFTANTIILYYFFFLVMFRDVANQMNSGLKILDKLFSISWVSNRTSMVTEGLPLLKVMHKSDGLTSGLTRMRQ